jgi:hypothetical protein
MIKLKNILNEAYAWERQDGKPLPTLKDVQEAYDAKGVEDAVDEAAEGAKPDYIDLDGDGNEEESMKSAAADANKKAEQNPKDGKSKEDLPSKYLAIQQMKETEGGPAYKGPIGYDDSTDSYSNEGDDSEETDLGVLNMGSLEESKFWGRVTGNLKGHDYILREAFRK